MKYIIEKKINNSEIIQVVIELLKHFSITFCLYDKTYKDKYESSISRQGKKYTLVSGGCSPELILQHFPEFAMFVDLHLSDLDGRPLYYSENGFYHLTEYLSGKIEKKVVLRYLRLTESQLADLEKMSNKSNFRYRYELFLEDVMMSIWAKQAQTAKNKLKELIDNE